MFNPVQRIWASLCHWYLLYELNTSVYMLDYTSKVVVNMFVVTIVSLITYSSYVYLPPYLYTMLAFFNLAQPAAQSGTLPADGPVAGASILPQTPT